MIQISDKKLNKQMISLIADLLLESFKKDKLYHTVFSNDSEILSFFTLLLTYYNKIGQIHTAYVGERIVAASIWNPQGAPIINIRNLIKNGFLFSLIKFILNSSLKSLARLKKEILITERHHLKIKHHYLYVIGSVYKGAGKALMQYAAEKLGDCPLYLENSNINDNKVFYEKCGFYRLDTIDVLGVEIDLLTNCKGEQL